MEKLIGFDEYYEEHAIKTADAMFEELGYEKDVMHYNCDNTDVYTYKKDNDFIRFRTADKCMVTLYKTTFSSEELKAINKKVEELRMELEKCKFCKTKVFVQVERLSKPLLAPLTEVQQLKDELINKTGIEYIQIKNNYCPMCGRKLV